MSDLARLNESFGGRYAMQRELGQGGMATVYLARDMKHDRDVALKVLRPDLAVAVGADRFLAEIKLTAALQHPNILPLFDSGAAGGQLYYVMPYVRGETLRARVAREGALPVEEAIAIARGIATALEHAHGQGVVHRDIKPENVLLSDGVPIVADFGIARAVNAASGARVTQAGMTVGTPAYMSPEQLTGELDVDRRADVYSLGCVLFEMLTGEAPYTGPSAAAVFSQHLVAPVPSARTARATVPPAIDAAITRALAKERDDRFASAAEMSAALVATPPVEPLPDYSKVLEPVTRNTAPLAGRRKELADVIGRLDTLRDGRGGMVLIGGEPGVGKTKLAEAALLEARARGFVCVPGHCYEMDGSPPYLPFLEQLDYAIRTVPPGRLRAALGNGAAEIARIAPRLRQLYPDIPEPLDLPPDQQRHFLFTQFREFLARAAANVPLVYLFDDLHWADDSTLLLLEYLAAHLHEMRILFVGTYRDVELDVARPFAKSLERLTRQRLAARIALRRMPETDIAELLAQLGAPDPPPALVHAVYAETEGNPFFVEEVFRHLKDEGRLLDDAGRWRADLHIESLDVPEGVKLVIGRRLERVSAECRGVLTAAAVIGARFDLAVLEAVAELPPDAMLDALEEAERAGLVIAQQLKRETRYTFAHELIRQTLVGSLSVPRRLRRHLKTAEAIERIHATRVEQHASELAYHFFQAGPAAEEEKTTRYVLLAGQNALAAGAFDEALAHAEKAFSIMESADVRRRANLLWLRASALRGLGRWSAARDAFLEALDAFEQLGAESEMLRLAAMLAEMLYYYGSDHTRLVSIVTRVLDGTRDEAGVDRARLLAFGANALALTGEYGGAMAMSDRAVAMADALGDRATRASVISERVAILTNYGHIAEALPLAEEACGLLDQSARRWEALWARSRLVHSLRFAGNQHRVAAMAPELLREANLIGHIGASLTLVTAETAAQWALNPRLEQWDSVAELFRRDFAELGSWKEMAHLFAAAAAFERDQPSLHLLAGASQRFAFGIWEDLIWMVEFELAAHENPVKARSILVERSASIPVADQEFPLGACGGLGSVVRGLVQLGGDGRRRAAAMYPACVRLQEMGYLGDIFGLSAAVAGIASTAGRRWDDAERCFSDALRLAHEFPHVPAQADARLWYARMLLDRRAAGDAVRARTLLEEAIPLFERAGRVRWLRECRATHASARD